MAAPDPSFARPAHELAQASVAPPHVATAPSPAQGLALDHNAKIQTGLTYALPGNINSDGTTAQGTGFSVNKTGTGVYAITFTTPFAATPNIQVTISDSAALWHTSSRSASGFTVTTTGTGGGAADHAFDFLAFPTPA